MYIIRWGGGRKKEHTLAPPYQQLPVCTQIGCGDRDTISVIHDTDQDFSTLFSLNTLELTDTKYTLTNTRFNYMCYTFMTYFIVTIHSWHHNNVAIRKSNHWHSSKLKLYNIKCKVVYLIFVYQVEANEIIK